MDQLNDGGGDNDDDDGCLDLHGLNQTGTASNPFR